MFRYEVRGFFYEDGDRIPFVLITPPLYSSYQARIYTVGKLKKYGDSLIIQNDIARIID